MRGEARADVAHELEGRGGVGMGGAIHTILEDQVLLGERLGLAVVPRRAERVRDVSGTGPTSATFATSIHPSLSASEDVSFDAWRKKNGLVQTPTRQNTRD